MSKPGISVILEKILPEPRGKVAEVWNRDEVLDHLYARSDSPVLLDELLALFRCRYGQIDFIDEPVDFGFECPLDLHCTYTRDQLLAALDRPIPAKFLKKTNKLVVG